MNEKMKKLLPAIILIVSGYLLLIGAVVFLLLKLNSTGISRGVVNPDKNTNKTDEAVVAELNEENHSETSDDIESLEDNAGLPDNSENSNDESQETNSTETQDDQNQSVEELDSTDN